MQADTPRWRRWGLAGAMVLFGLATGTLFTGTAMGALDGGTRGSDEISVSVTRIENPETRFFRTNISAGEQAEDVADLYIA